MTAAAIATNIAAVHEPMTTRRMSAASQSVAAKMMAHPAAPFEWDGSSSSGMVRPSSRLPMLRDQRSHIREELVPIAVVVDECFEVGEESLKPDVLSFRA